MSYDDFWMPRGHTSKNECWVEPDAGLISDKCVRKHGYICAKIKNNYMNNEQFFNKKKATHKESGQYQCTFEGTSGGMEKQMTLNKRNRPGKKNTNVILNTGQRL